MAWVKGTRECWHRRKARSTFKGNFLMVYKKENLLTYTKMEANKYFSPDNSDVLNFQNFRSIYLNVSTYFRIPLLFYKVFFFFSPNTCQGVNLTILIMRCCATFSACYALQEMKLSLNVLSEGFWISYHTAVI